MGLAALSVGTVFAGDYKIEAPLMSGGMGAVYIVEQQSTGKRRALKVMHPQLVSNPDLRARFEREARIGSRIDSENIVEVQAAGVDAPTGTPYIIMELLRGSDLARHMVTGPMPIANVREIAEQFCSAVGAAHVAGVVHRDLKPENVFLAQSRLTQTGVIVKVLDFGIAKLAAAAGSTAAMGSPMWMPPEQTDRTAITPAADVWSIGLILYYMLTGKFFWKAANDEEAPLAQLLREILMEPIPPASVRAQEQGAVHLVPPQFDAWFARCVVRPPHERFIDASEAWKALEPIFGPRTSLASFPEARNFTPSAPGVTPPPLTSTPTPLRQSHPQQPQKGMPIWIPIMLMTLAGLASVVGLVWKFQHDQRDKEKDRTAAAKIAAPTPSPTPDPAPLPTPTPTLTPVASVTVAAAVVDASDAKPPPVIAAKPAKPAVGLVLAA